MTEFMVKVYRNGLNLKRKERVYQLSVYKGLKFTLEKENKYVWQFIKKIIIERFIRLFGVFNQTLISYSSKQIFSKKNVEEKYLSRSVLQLLQCIAKLWNGV